MRGTDLFPHPERSLPTLEDFRTAATRIAPYVRDTPVLQATVDGRPVVLKLEHLQVTGVFKIRGALNALLAPGGTGLSHGGLPAPHSPRPPGTPPSGGTRPVPPAPPVPSARGKSRAPGPPVRVITASGGNHGLGVATAARWLGIPATVFVPGTVPEVKARRIAAAGADVVRTGSKYADAERAARDLASRQGLYYVHAYDDPAVVAGQGTVGLEIASDLPGADVVAVPVGGGGLLAGVSGAIAPRRAVAVEPEGCPTLHAAVAAGAPVEVGADSVAASALGASRAGDLALAAYRNNQVGLALVSDQEILAARDRLWEEFRLAVEPAAATVFAAWLAGRVPGDDPCLLLSGANADWVPARI